MTVAHYYPAYACNAVEEIFMRLVTQHQNAKRIVKKYQLISLYMMFEYNGLYSSSKRTIGFEIEVSFTLKLLLIKCYLICDIPLSSL